MPNCLHHWLAHHAKKRPNATAAEFLDDALTYAELDVRANQMAHALVDAGIAHGDRVGIYMDKSIETPVALYGIMKAGAAYVPLDPASSATRLAGLLQDAEIDCVVSARDKRRTLAQLAEMDASPTTLIWLDKNGFDHAGLADRQIDRSAVDRYPASAPELDHKGDDLAYIIYTSGSTGTPKGIMHTHRSSLAFSRWAASEYGFVPEDRLSNHAPLHFDLSIMDYFSAVVAGATTVIIPEDYTRLPASYAKLIDEARISVLYTVPFALIQLLLRGATERFDYSHLRWVIFGGEPFAPAHLCALMARWPHARFDNIYGPAEVNGVTHYVVPKDHDPKDALPIGYLAQDAACLIVDDHDNPVDAGDTGELLVATNSMMPGYWNRPDLNAGAFFEQPLNPEATRRYYRTGDMVRAEPDGLLHYVGRRDRQVKIRGYRVELDHVELALTGHPAVEEGAAYPVTDAEGVTHVYAEATLREDTQADRGDLVRYVKERLPWYAVPSKLDITKHFPRTTSGKIDRKSLAEVATERLLPPSGTG